MENMEIIKDIFNKTRNIIEPVWTGKENPQMGHVLYYLSLAACYLKNKEEVETFKYNWGKIKNLVEKGSDKTDYFNQTEILEENIKQALAGKKTDNSKFQKNTGLAIFYEHAFRKLYNSAKSEYIQFQRQKDNLN